MKPDDEAWPAAPEAEAFKLALFALVRLKAYEPLAAAVLDGDRPVSTWWPVAYALQRIEDPRARAGAAAARCRRPGRYTAGVRGARARRAQARPLPPTRLIALLDAKAKAPLEVVVSAIRALAQINAPAAAAPLAALASEPGTDPNVRLEAVDRARHDEGERRACRRAGSAHRRLAGDARGRAAGGGGDRSGGVHVRAVRAGAGPRLARARRARRGARHAAAARSRSSARAACCRTATSASSAPVLGALVAAQGAGCRGAC